MARDDEIQAQPVEPRDDEIMPIDDDQAEEITKLNRFDDEQLRSIQTYEDAERLLLEEYGADAISDIGDWIGNGFRVLSKEQKSLLVGKPFLILDWSFNTGDMGQFVSARIMTVGDNGKFVLNDGSSGIYADLRELTNRTRKNTGYRVKGGLRVSQYDTCASCDRPRRKDDAVCPNLLSNDTPCGDESKERHRGETYYLDTSV